MQYAQEGKQWHTKSAFYIRDVRRYMISEQPPYGYGLSSKYAKKNCNPIIINKSTNSNTVIDPFCKHFSGRLYYPNCISKNYH